MNLRTLTLCIAVMLLTLPPVSSAQFQLSNGTMGKEFWIALPPNETSTFPTRYVEIYVTSRKNTLVTLEIPGLGFLKKKQVEAFKTITFGASDGIGNNFEVRESGVTPYSIRITAEEPIAVNVQNSKTTTSEGFTALPVSVWGKENIHCSYYDFGESAPWGGGFLVVASQDNTVITVKIKGKGFGRTESGNKIGEVIVKTLNKGDVFNMRGDGATMGSFDLTGTTITSNKPVGLISYHMRTMIPAIANNNGRDHLAEMIPPTSAWGKKFVSSEFKRKGKGDLFRAVAKEDGTIVTGIWYDNVTRQKIGQKQWTLSAGQFEQSMYASTSPGGEDVRGFSVWTSNKPILLMQYAYSAQWDGDSQYDPFMIVIPPLEQYVQEAVFQTPSNTSFVTNWFTVFAVGDSTDPEAKLLKTIKLDGKYIYQTSPQLVLQRFPATNIYYVQINVPQGSHRVEGETKLGGFMYGFSDFNTYAWPAVMAVNKIDDLDTLAPELKIVQDCGIFNISATEIQNGNLNDDPRQIESGVSDVMVINELSTNFKTTPDPAEIQNDPKITKHDFTLEVLDLSKDARAVYEVIDLAGNVVRDTVEYIAAKLALQSTSVDFGKVRVGMTKEMDIILKNNGTIPVLLTNLTIRNPDIFFVSPFQQQQLSPGAEVVITVRYSPKMEFTDQFYDKDSIVVFADCARFAFAMAGRGVMPKIAVGDFDAGLVKIGEKVCLEKGLFVTNTGTDNVTVTEITGFETPFSFSNSPQLPVTIAPGDTLFLKDVCFQSGTPGNFVQNVIFKSDAMTGDSVSEWRASVQPTDISGEVNNHPVLKISPNPVSNGEVAISYSVANSGTISIGIFDASGKSLHTLVNEKHDPGSFKKSFSAGDLPSGIYYCRLMLDGKVIAIQEIIIAK